MSEQKNDWNQVKVGDLLTEHSERSTSINQHEVLSVTKEGIFSQQEYFKKQIASEDNSGYKVVRKGDVVFSAMNLWMGSIDVVKDQEVGIVSPAYITMRPTAGLVDTDFLGYFLRGDEMRKRYVQHSQQGASIVRRNLNKDDLLGDEVCIPPLPEQKKIARILSQLDSEISTLEARLKKGKHYVSALSRRIFGELISDESVPKCFAEELCSLVTKGTTPSKSLLSGKQSVPFLRVTNLGFDGLIDPTQDFELISESSHKGELKRSICRPGDILMNIVGPPLGKVGVIPVEIGECNINQAVLVYRLAGESIDAQYFVNYLLGQVAQTWLRSQSKKTSGQQNLTIEICKSLVVPMPSILAQKKVSSFLDSAGRVNNLISRKIDSLEFLKRAVASDLLSGRKRVSV